VSKEKTVRRSEETELFSLYRTEQNFSNSFSAHVSFRTFLTLRKVHEKIADKGLTLRYLQMFIKMQKLQKNFVFQNHLDSTATT